MGTPLMIQKKDNELIESLKKDLGIHKKIEVVRAALHLLQLEALRQRRVKRWKHAAKLVAKNSLEVNKEFQAHSRMKGLKDN